VRTPAASLVAANGRAAKSICRRLFLCPETPPQEFTLLAQFSSRNETFCLLSWRHGWLEWLLKTEVAIAWILLIAIWVLALIEIANKH
jgi:hypothetical protein